MVCVYMAWTTHDVHTVNWRLWRWPVSVWYVQHMMCMLLTHAAGCPQATLLTRITQSSVVPVIWATIRTWWVRPAASLAKPAPTRMPLARRPVSSVPKVSTRMTRGPRCARDVCLVPSPTKKGQRTARCVRLAITTSRWQPSIVGLICSCCS